MDIIHLKYVAEIAKTGSMTKAADNLYMYQANLSKAIKELESELGIIIFKRSSKGATLTKDGAELLLNAKDIIYRFDQMELLYKKDTDIKKSFSISVPRASYVSFAFTKFINAVEGTKNLEMDFCETNSMQAINNIVERKNNIGIIRYALGYEKYYSKLLKDLDIKCEILLDFKYLAVMSVLNPLASSEAISSNELSDMIEIVHGDSSIPSLSCGHIHRSNMDFSISKCIMVYERGSQFDLLVNVPTSYMLVSPIPDEMIKQYNLVQKHVHNVKDQYRDVLIYHKEYKFSDTDRLFINKLHEIRDEIVLKLA